VTCPRAGLTAVLVALARLAVGRFGLEGFGLEGFGLEGFGLEGFGLEGFGLEGFGLEVTDPREGLDGLVAARERLMEVLRFTAMEHS
jgi:hypothetical protein